MAFRLSQRSLTALVGVHPDLVRVVKRAIEITDQDFLVVQGRRSKEEAWENWGKGRTLAQCRAAGVPDKYAKPGLAKVTFLKNPLSTNHLVKADGYGHAVDLSPYPVDYEGPAKFPKHEAIAKAMKAAAAELGIKTGWGGDWKTTKDRPHFELVR